MAEQERMSGCSRLLGAALGTGTSPSSPRGCAGSGGAAACSVGSLPQLFGSGALPGLGNECSRSRSGTLTRAAINTQLHY